MRVWLGHDKDPKLLEEDLRWWLKQQQFGLYPRSVQAENISGVGWLLYSTKEVACDSLQSAISKQLGDRFEIGCRYKMISLGRRGPVPKDNQVKAIHVECDSACHFDVKIDLSRTDAPSKNEAYPTGLRLLLVSGSSSMISPATRQQRTRLPPRHDSTL